MTAHQLRELYASSASSGGATNGSNPGGAGSGAALFGNPGAHMNPSQGLLDLSPVAPLRYRPYDPIQLLQQQGAVSKLLGN